MATTSVPVSLAFLGASQLINWGVLYYGLAVIVIPLSRELGVPGWMLASTQTLAFLVSAMFAPMAARIQRNDHAGQWIAAGCWGAAAAILCLGAMPLSIGGLCVFSVAVGASMSVTLYETSFAAIGRAPFSSAARIRALATVTLFGGLAGPCFAPLVTALIDLLGWRLTMPLLAAALFLSSRLAIKGLATLPENAPVLDLAPASTLPIPQSRARISLLFGLMAVGQCALTVLAVPLLVDRGWPTAQAALVVAMVGLAQLGGRGLLLSPRWSLSTPSLIVWSALLQMAGILSFVHEEPSVVLVGAALFGTGAGVATIIRPAIVQEQFGPFCQVTQGQIARDVQCARALAPFAIMYLVARIGDATVFAALSVGFGLAAAGAWRLVQHTRW